MKKYLIFLQIFSTLIFLSNCSFNKQENKIQISDTEIYSKGLTSLQEGDFAKANLEFDEVFINYPFSSLAKN